MNFIGNKKILLPSGLLFILVFFALVGIAWTFKRAPIYGPMAWSQLLHPVRKFYQRFPSFAYFFSKPSPQAAHYVDQLNENGIIHIPQFLNDEELKEIRQDFQNMIKDAELNHENDLLKSNQDYRLKAFVDIENKVISQQDPFAFSQKLIETLCAHRLTEIINHYLRGPAYIGLSVASRVYPGGPKNTGSYQWHNDAWDKKVNVMILLTDVGEGDQYMTYVLRSNKLSHSLKLFTHGNSRVTLDYCKQNMKEVKIFKCIGKAGDVFAFDPNGIHSGNRTDGRTRDTVITGFTRDKSYFYHFSFPENAFHFLQKNQHNPFAKVLESEKSDPARSFAPPYTCWVHSLPYPTSWL